MPSATKSAATDFVSPMTAALVAPYAQRSATPVIELATDDMLMIEPARAARIAGRNARIMWYIEVTLRVKAASQCAGSMSSTVPMGTEPAQLKSTSALPTVFANEAIDEGSRTSSTWPSQPTIEARDCPLMSAANTRAPARANASALARPMPEPAAVTTAVLPESLLDSIRRLRHSRKNQFTVARIERREQCIARRPPVIIRAHELAHRPVAAPHHAPRAELREQVLEAHAH